MKKIVVSNKKVMVKVIALGVVLIASLSILAGCSSEYPLVNIANATEQRDSSTTLLSNTYKAAQSEGSPSYGVATLIGSGATVDITVTDYGYDPSVVIVPKGVETTFNFDIQGYSCALFIVMPQQSGYLDLRETTSVTQTLESDFIVTCSMGMYGFKVIVVDDLSDATISSVVEDIKNNSSDYSFQDNSSGYGSCGGGSGSSYCGNSNQWSY